MNIHTKTFRDTFQIITATSSTYTSMIQITIGTHVCAQRGDWDFVVAEWLQEQFVPTPAMYIALYPNIYHNHPALTVTRSNKIMSRRYDFMAHTDGLIAGYTKTDSNQSSRHVLSDWWWCWSKWRRANNPRKSINIQCILLFHHFYHSSFVPLPGFFVSCFFVLCLPICGV